MPDGQVISEVIIWPNQGGTATFLKGGEEGTTEVETMISPNEWYVTRMVNGRQIGLIHQLVSNDGKTMSYTPRIPGTMEGKAVFDKQ